MNAVGSILTAPLKAIGLIKTPKLSPATSPVVLPTATRDAIREDDSTLDALRRRRGGAADILSGDFNSGASSTAAGGKVQLG